MKNIMTTLPKFKRTPMCEVCREKPANSFSLLATGEGFVWRYVCDCAIEESEIYYIKIADFLESPEKTLGWLAHIGRKSHAERLDFDEMLHRFAKATGSQVP